MIRRAIGLGGDRGIGIAADRAGRAGGAFKRARRAPPLGGRRGELVHALVVLVLERRQGLLLRLGFLLRGLRLFVFFLGDRFGQAHAAPAFHDRFEGRRV